MEHVTLGRINRLRIVKEVDFGLYLDGGADGEILLPSRYVPDTFQIDEEIEVFIYLDMEERLVATTLTPFIQVGEFGVLRVAWVNEHGAFLDWGLMKDLFVPFREQKQRMEKDRYYMVYAHVDEESYRIMATAKVEKFLSKEIPNYLPKQAVNVLVWTQTDLGYKVIVENKFSGLLYKNEVFQTLRPGMRLQAYVKQVRADGKLDLTLHRGGSTQTADFADVLLVHIQEQGGKTAFHDKSEAEEIYATFQVSKKVFKKAVGDLYRRRLIVLEEDGIRLA